MIWIDLVIVGALLLGLGVGAKRGFLQTLGGVAAVVVSFIGAGIAAGALSGTVAKWIRPLREKKMQSGGISGGSAASMVREAGYFGETAQRIVDSVGTLVQETKELYLDMQLTVLNMIISLLGYGLQIRLLRP